MSVCPHVMYVCVSTRDVCLSTRHVMYVCLSLTQCLSYVEDCLMALNENSILLAESLQEKPDMDLSEVLPKVTESLR